MKTTFLLIALAVPVLAQQSFDFSLLDKLGTNAKNKTNITLEGDMLKLASGFLGSDKENEKLKGLVDNLRGIYIRSFEFDKPGQYSEADLEPFRAFLKQQSWSRIVESREGAENSEIYVQPKQSKQVGGMAIISGEAKELTIVYISGQLNIEDLAALGGNMGIPNIQLNHGAGRAAPKKEK